MSEWPVQSLRVAQCVWEGVDQKWAQEGMKNFGAITATTLLHDLSSYQCQLMLNFSYSINSKTKLKLRYGVERAFGKIIICITLKLKVGSPGNTNYVNCFD